MCLFIKKMFFKPYLIDNKGDDSVFFSNRYAKKAYKRTENTKQDYSNLCNSSKYHTSIFKEIDCKYIWLGICKYSRYVRSGNKINSVCKHSNPEFKNMVLWYLFPISEYKSETRVVLCI